MGSRSRKRKQANRAVREVVQDMETSPTPMVTAVRALSDARQSVAMSRKRPTRQSPAHALAKESSGHQYIGGSRARGVSLTTEERKINRQARIERYGKMVTRSKTVTDKATGEKHVVKWRELKGGDPTAKRVRAQGADRVDALRGNQESIVSGREVEDKDLVTVKRTYGTRKRLTKAEQRERLFSGNF